METPILSPGTRIKLNFGASDGKWRRATQAAIIEWRLDAHPEEFSVRSIDYQKKGLLVFEIDIKKSSKKLWSERKIVDLILGYNPMGFTLVFTNAVWEFVKETVVPAMKLTTKMIFAIALLAGVVLYSTKSKK